ncbi:MAG: helix-turn-helix transcriptional regulator [Gammaproteobacteria bacterium]|nr:helix-turn-helix transcriptional regulator [Gammaproteobacteria bacterium]
MMHRQHIGQKLKASRKGKKMSQTEAGRSIGVSHAVISKIETGKYTGSLKIYEKYITSMGYFLTIESELPQMPEFESLSKLFSDE